MSTNKLSCKFKKIMKNFSNKKCKTNAINYAQQLLKIFLTMTLLSNKNCGQRKMPPFMENFKIKTSAWRRKKNLILTEFKFWKNQRINSLESMTKPNMKLNYCRRKVKTCKSNYKLFLNNEVKLLCINSRWSSRSKIKKPLQILNQYRRKCKIRTLYHLSDEALVRFRDPKQW